MYSLGLMEIKLLTKVNCCETGFTLFKQGFQFGVFQFPSISRKTFRGLLLSVPWYIPKTRNPNHSVDGGVLRGEEALKGHSGVF